tara:strand:+ start:15379 stop:15609 length:231 start_codon:yes stop_codon:yes gene_type:complete
MSKYLKVESDTSLIRDVDSGAIINTNKGEYEKFMKLSKRKYEEKQEMKNLKDDVEGMKSDIQEIKSLLLSIAKNDL